MSDLTDDEIHPIRLGFGLEWGGRWSLENQIDPYFDFDGLLSSMEKRDLVRRCEFPQAYRYYVTLAGARAAGLLHKVRKEHRIA